MTDDNRGELAAHEWLKNEATQKVMRALGGADGEARFVGGCVRNALLMEPVNDVDIATVHTPEEAMLRLEGAGVKVVPTGIEHGTVTAVIDGRHFEVTTLRVDVSTDGRRADVTFTEDWLEDAKRRDFTVNALYADIDGTVYDPLDGRDDIKARRVRFIGDAGERIREDYLRILRFFRFHAHYGTGEPDASGRNACAEEKEGLAQLSAERVQSELLKLLGADGAGPAVRQMAAAGILPLVFPEATRLDRFETLVDIESNQLFVSDPILRLSSAVELDKAGVDALADRLRLSNKDRSRITAMQTDQTKIVCYLSVREVHRALYWMGVQCFRDRVMLGWAADGKSTNAMQWRAMVAMADSWERPKMLLTGSMMQAAGVPEGPEMSRVFREVEEWWVDAGFTDDEFSLIERLKAIVQATVY
ncbi:MAG: CCA tRNA nucleotidyltransferase [Rhodobiaceae bacterium]|nr:MAG: CCA tRNA nucleotidyltransferase [Rhodobiaceae bacterium]